MEKLAWQETTIALAAAVTPEGVIEITHGFTRDRRFYIRYRPKEGGHWKFDREHPYRWRYVNYTNPYWWIEDAKAAAEKLHQEGQFLVDARDAGPFTGYG